MLEKLFIFFVFLCPLIFFHELGHFLFARLFGVRVEVFSLGFGPKLFRKKWGDTEYAFSLIPLGGYVKMFGDDPLNKDSVPEEDRKYSFTHKSKWARFWIVFGGPLANFIMAFGIFFLLLLVGEKIPEFRMGIIPQDNVLFEKGFRSGDVVTKVDGKEVYNPSDIVVTGTDKIQVMTVRRQNQEVEIPINMSGKKLFDEYVEINQPLRRPIIVNNKSEIFAVSMDGCLLEKQLSLDEIADQKLEKIYLTKITDKQFDDFDDAEIVPTKENFLTIPTNSRNEFFIKLAVPGYKPIDMRIRSISRNSPADKAGIRGHDVVHMINGKQLNSFETLRKVVQGSDEEKAKVDVKLWREGKIIDLAIEPDLVEQNGKVVKVIGVYVTAGYQPVQFIRTESKGFFGSISGGIARTWDSIIKTIDGYKKLVTNEVSFKTIGGPIAIANVASDSFKMSISYFFQIMAIISINLGIINLFPVPVLDGGHIMFILLEIINRGPLSRRKMEIAQQFGLSLLLVLTFAALFNDFSRFF